MAGEDDDVILEGSHDATLESDVAEAWDKLEAEPEQADEATEGAETEAAPEQDAEATEGGQPEAMEAPAHWAAADRDMFARQTPEAQKWLLERSKGMEAAHTQRSQEIAPLRQVIQKWDPYLKQIQATPEQTFETLLQTEQVLRTGTNEQKVEVLHRLIDAYRIQEPQNETEINPQMAEMQRQMAEMRQMLESGRQTDEQSRLAAAQQQQENRLQAFAEAKDGNGQLLHPFFGEVQDEMTRLAQADIAAGRQPELENLYDRAVWANPQTRQRMMADQQKAAAEKARLAAVSIEGSGGPPVQAQPETPEEAARAAYELLSR